MATQSQFNHTLYLIGSGQVTESDILKLVLLDSSAAFDATHTTLAQVTGSGAYEVFGYGWLEGGYTLQNLSWDINATSGAILTADNVSQAISGGTLPSYNAWAIYVDDGASNAPLWYWQQSTSQSISDGRSVTINGLTDGIFTMSKST
jgi:hypothetical protein